MAIAYLRSESAGRHPLPITELAVGDLADRLGTVKAEIADLEEVERALRAEIIARGAKVAEGALFKATVSATVRWQLDHARLKAEFGESWLTQRSRPVTVTAVRVAAR